MTLRNGIVTISIMPTLNPLSDTDRFRHPTLALALETLTDKSRITKATIARLVMQATEDEIDRARKAPGEFGPEEMAELTATLKRLQGCVR